MRKSTWRAIILVPILNRSKQLCNSWIVPCRCSTRKSKLVCYVVITVPATTASLPLWHIVFKPFLLHGITLQEKNLADKLNIVLFSDHGMTKIQWMEKVIELLKFINKSDIVKMMDRGPVVNLWTKDSSSQKVRPGPSSAAPASLYQSHMFFMDIFILYLDIHIYIYF